MALRQLAPSLLALSHLALSLLALSHLALSQLAPRHLAPIKKAPHIWYVIHSHQFISLIFFWLTVKIENYKRLQESKIALETTALAQPIPEIVHLFILIPNFWDFWEKRKKFPVPELQYNKNCMRTHIYLSFMLFSQN